MTDTPHKNRPAEMKSIIWNIDREHVLAALVANGSLPRPIAPQSVDGWFRVSRHAAGTAGAYAVQTKLRKSWPQLQFKVVPNNKPSVPWNAEIWARKKDA